jgi:hypothetical protein
MTKGLRMLAGGVVLGAVMLGFGAFRTSDAYAESPPNPPSRFVGSVLVDGAAPPAGTRIEAKIGNSTCGVTTTFSSGGSRYALDVPALDPGATPNCGTDGATVTFWIGDRQAAETGKWANYQLNTVNLTYTTPATPGGPAAPPKPPVTGTGTVSEDGSSFTLLFGLGVIALAFGAGSMAVSRRRS